MTEEAAGPVLSSPGPSSAHVVDSDEERREGRPPPQTGDPVIDAALRDLADAPVADLDAQLAAGEAVHRTLQSRLTDLGG